jgi:NAD-dependent SIR2 family protein deacetylase
MSEKETYIVEVYCTNCGYQSTEEKPKGQERQKGKKCPNCGCLTLNETQSKRY